MNKEIISTNEEDKPLIWISDKAINLYKDNEKLQERINKAIEYIREIQDSNVNNDLSGDEVETIVDILRGD